MNKSNLRTVITDILEYLDVNSKSAVELLMLTASVESQLGEYIIQLNNGPARGIFQMEPATEFDCWTNYLDISNKDLGTKIKTLMMSGADNLTYNIAYQIAMCRVRYYRETEQLPGYSDINGLATYWKRYYNTYSGKGTVEKAIFAYRKYAL